MDQTWQYHYVLVDPRIDDSVRAVFYVGRAAGGTRTPAKRLWEHLDQASRGHKSYKCNKIRQIWTAGHEPKLLILPSCAGDDNLEAELILSYRANGAGLTNATEGGGGCRGYAHTEEARKRIRQGNKISQSTQYAKEHKSQKAKQGWADAETRLKRIEGLKRASEDPIVKLNRKQANERLWDDPEFREKHRSAMNNPEVRSKIKAACSTPEMRERRSVASRSAMAKAEVRDKLSASVKVAMSKPEVKMKQSAGLVAAWSRSGMREKIRTAWALKQGMSLEQLNDLETMVAKLASGGISGRGIAERCGITPSRVGHILERHRKEKGQMAQDMLN